MGTHLHTNSYIQSTMREVFIDLKDEKSDINDFNSATKFVPRCSEKLQRDDFALTHGCWTKKPSP